MPDSCMPTYRCSTHAPIWLNGSHPSPADGVVTRQLCVHWNNDCCYFQPPSIQVKACPGNYTVYEFVDPFHCYLAYCAAPIGNVVCSESFMAIEVSKTQSEKIRIHGEHLRLNDPTCTLYSNGTHVFAKMSLNTCGTVMEEDDTNVIFKNEIVSVDNPNDIISRHHQVEIQFFCKFPKKSNVTLEFDAHKNPYVFVQKGFGIFSYQFEFFQSSQFRNLEDPSSYPLEYDLGDMMYMQIEATSPVNNTELFVESCKASPSDDPNAHISYSIISNGCNQDETVQFYSSHGNIVKFGMKAFKFIGLYDQVFIVCSVILCEAGNPSTRCSQGCTNTTATPAAHRHHRREAAIQTLSHFISQGPLRLRRTTSIRNAASTVTTGSLDMNVVFIAGCLLVAVGMFCGVLIYTKRPKAVYQPSSDSINECGLKAQLPFSR
ncbi:hypothetical protein ACEWY4_002439 [Coilia grayii]|uniref:ZP domain-containing protein n=1 Tax=Coilia grayii TaxID=363190 RepID=A0ABD1KNC6_9TELE